MALTESQRRLLNSADNDGRVFIGSFPSREASDLIDRGYLEQNVYDPQFYWVKKTADGKPVSR